MKYRIHDENFIKSLDNNQPIWLIEENARIFRKEEYARPRILPKIKDRIKENFINSFVKLVCKQDSSKRNGANFCQVKTIKIYFQDNPSNTWGTHKWKGAAPSLISKEILKIRLIWEEINENLESAIIAKIADLTKTAEARVWIKKYFKVDSATRGDLECKNKAKRETILISNLIQAINQEEADAARIDLETNIIINIIFQGRIKIKRRIGPYLGYEPKSLN